MCGHWQFLMEMQIMDYSLLVGCHDLIKGNKDKIRDNTLAVFEPNAETLSRRQTQSSNRRGSKASAMRRMLAQADPIQLGPSSAKLPDDSPPERKFCVFYRDSGGFIATDENDQTASELYFIGIIDIFTKYDSNKKMEHFFKSLTNDGVSHFSSLFLSRSYIVTKPAFLNAPARFRRKSRP
jgi:1-phosphatidylinositol-4-phosphate 5-kinase